MPKLSQTISKLVSLHPVCHPFIQTSNRRIYIGFQCLWQKPYGVGFGSLTYVGLHAMRSINLCSSNLGWCDYSDSSESNSAFAFYPIYCWQGTDFDVWKAFLLNSNKHVLKKEIYDFDLREIWLGFIFWIQDLGLSTTSAKLLKHYSLGDIF